MAWYNEKGEMQDVVISTRVRFARNLEDHPFAARLDDKGADEIIEKVCAALPEYRSERFFDGMNPKCRAYMEMHYVSPEFVESERHRALLTGENEHVHVMVCEEDHLRIQSIVAGFDPKTAFEYASRADDALGRSLKIAFSEKYGYLTHCPTNLGAAMRVSAMLCLPALTINRSIERYINAAGKMGITVRGLYGEGSRASGCLYQISNKASLGMGESEIIKLMSEVVTKLAEAERQSREMLFDVNEVKLTDKIARCAGVLKNAHTLTSSEANESFSELKLGVSLGVLKNMTDEKLNEMLIAVQPAIVSMLKEGLENDTERDIARAALVRDMLCEVTVDHG